MIKGRHFWFVKTLLLLELCSTELMTCLLWFGHFKTLTLIEFEVVEILMGGISIAAVLILKQTNHKRTTTVTN